MITLSITSAGVPWSAAELARISVAFVGGDDAPIEIIQCQLEALGYRVTAIQGFGMEVSAEVEPNVTDEQIHLLRIEHDTPSPMWVREYRIALGVLRTVNDPDGDCRRARARCAVAVNAKAALRGGRS